MHFIRPYLLTYHVVFYRNLWTVPRPQLWWDTFKESVNDAQWRQHFRMSRGTFFFVVNNVRDLMTRQATRYREVKIIIKWFTV